MPLLWPNDKQVKARDNAIELLTKEAKSRGLTISFTPHGHVIKGAELHPYRNIHINGQRVGRLNIVRREYSYRFAIEVCDSSKPIWNYKHRRFLDPFEKKINRIVSLMEEYLGAKVQHELDAKHEQQRRDQAAKDRAASGSLAKQLRRELKLRGTGLEVRGSSKADKVQIELTRILPEEDARHLLKALMKLNKEITNG